MQQTPFLYQPITDETTCGIWGFYPEIMDLKKKDKKKKKCCKSYKEKEGRCKKCPMNS